MGNEDYMGNDLKAPVWFTSLMEKVLWAMTFYYFVYYCSFLGDTVYAFNIWKRNGPKLASDPVEQFYYYEDLYHYKRLPFGSYV